MHAHRQLLHCCTLLDNRNIPRFVRLASGITPRALLLFDTLCHMLDQIVRLHTIVEVSKGPLVDNQTVLHKPIVD
jgi:hypothetical protein